MPLQHVSCRPSLFRRPISRLAFVFIIQLLLALRASATNVLTQHNDNSRDGANLTETNLTAANVNVSQFGKLFTRSVDGQVYAQTLYVNNVTISGKTQDVVFVVTEHDSVYAFDADTPANTTPLWQVSLGTSVPTSFFSCGDLRPEVGITSTPVIDPTTGTIYVVAKNQVTVSSTSTNYFHQLHALDITTGAEKFGGPATINPTFNGINFNALHQNPRAALLLLSNVVYVAESSHCDSTPYNGWLLGFNATNLAPVSVFNTTSTSTNGEGAIWSCGMGPAADTNGNIYVTTGNGLFNATNGTGSGTNYGQCFMKFSTTNGFAVADWFSPYNEATLSSSDRDIGTGGAVLLPGTHLLMGLGKNGTNYLLDQNHLGHQSQNGISDTNIVQEFLATLPVDRIGQSPVIWNGPGNEYIYLSCGNSNTLTYTFNGSTIQTTPLAVSAAKQASSPGGLSLSANGNSNGILWVVYNVGGGLLYAYNATNMPTALWSSTNNSARDSFVGSVKFVSPTIADGKVFVSTSNSVVVYGLLASVPSVGSNLVWTGASGVNSNWSTALNWTNPVSFGNGPPQPTNYPVFDNTAAVSSPNTPNNAVDTSMVVAGLVYENVAANTSPNYNVTRINDGVTLTVTNGLSVSTGVDSGSNQVVNAAINGLNGTLVLSNGVFAVGQGSAADGPHQAVLDLSGLGNLDVTNVSRLAVAVGGQPPQSGNGAQRACGVLYLAKTNLVQVTSTGVTNGILVGWNDSQGNGNSSGVQNTLDDTSSLFLGQTNAIFSDAIYVGTDKTLGALLAFNPNGLTGPAAYFRNTDGVSRVSLWGIGDNSMKNGSNQSASGTNDFTGGSIDALINTMTIGITQTGASGSTNTGNGTGTLTFNGGTIDVNNLTNGASIGSGGTTPGSDVGTGVININGSATLKVNNNLALAQSSGGGSGVPSGTLNITAGTCLANTILAGTGSSVINLNNATLTVTNHAGGPGAPISTVATANSTLHLNLNGSAIITNVVANNLTATGVTTIAIDSIANVTTTTTFPLIRYASLSGSIANFTLGSVPANFAGILTNNSGAGQIDLIVTHAPATPVIASIILMNTNLVMSGTGGTPTWTYYLLASTNISTPLSNWSAVRTSAFDGFGNFQLTNGEDPTIPQSFYILQLP